eukprot:CAMPEP_0178996204 /NCGR_PEP_ID=MMETSP0795-20121207/8247_1 /TAXON_ID=88552 /ORGANISM="Amoebophrya sp., Strain Ameob2" /LENGTH=186 /DNA_ID=CAMNT_0020688585 /DNA_START=96 /DNA_END=657 /DNA_ORIENTATION=+
MSAVPCPAVDFCFAAYSRSAIVGSIFEEGTPDNRRLPPKYLRGLRYGFLQQALGRCEGVLIYPPSIVEVHRSMSRSHGSGCEAFSKVRPGGQSARGAVAAETANAGRGPVAGGAVQSGTEAARLLRGPDGGGELRHGAVQTPHRGVLRARAGDARRKDGTGPCLVRLNIDHDVEDVDGSPTIELGA